MKTPTLCLLAAVALVAAAPSASAMEFVPPPSPTPDCEPLPPGGGSGLLDQVQDIAHDGTTFACSTYGNGQEAADAGYDFGMALVGIVVGIVGPTADAVQDATCQFVFGSPDGSDDLPPYSRSLCQEIVVSFAMASPDWERLCETLPCGW